MSHKLLPLALLTLFLLPGCGGSSHESMMQDQIDYLERLGAILADVKDPASADAAKSKIKSLIDDITAMKKKADAMEEPSPEQLAALEKEYGPKGMAAGAKVMQEITRISQDPALEQKLGELLKQFENL